MDNASLLSNVSTKLHKLKKEALSWVNAGTPDWYQTSNFCEDFRFDQTKQNHTLKKQLDDIVAKDFGKQIKSVKDTLGADIKFNEQSITNLSVSLDEKYQSLSNMDYTLLQSNVDMSTNLHDLASASLGLAQVNDKLV